MSRRTIENHHTTLLNDLLERYPQLHMDISWVVLENDILHQGELKPRWKALLEKYPDRFALGSDLLGHYDDLGHCLGRYNAVLSELNPETVKKLAYENANGLWFGR